MAASTPVRRIVYLGAGGPFGTAMLDELLATGWHVVVLARTPAAFTAREHMTVVPFDLHDHNALVTAMRGAETVICSVSGRAKTGVNSFAMQRPLIDAAVAAGVRRYIPSEWATDHAHPAARALPVYESRRAVLRYLKEKAAAGEIEYTVFHSGVLFEWALLNGWLGVDIKDRHARIVDGGNHQVVVSTYRGCARATARALSPEHFAATANRELRTGDGTISQNGILGILERAAGVPFSVERLSAAECLRRGLEKLQRGESTPEAVRDCIAGSAYIEDGPFSWDLKDNQWLGLETENLEDIVLDVAKHVQ